jgi:hypothetical protein
MTTSQTAEGVRPKIGDEDVASTEYTGWSLNGDGKEGVDGSSPSEGFFFPPA